MSDLNLYDIHRLDPNAPSDTLAAQLTAQLNTAPDPLARQRIDTARAILGDPARRGRYDAHLADPAAPPITEATLAAIAGRPVPMQSNSLSAAFSQPNFRLVAIAAAVLGLVLIIVISAVSCTGSSDTETPASSATERTQSSTATATSTPKKQSLRLKGAVISEMNPDSPVSSYPATLEFISIVENPAFVEGKTLSFSPRAKDVVRAYWAEGKSLSGPVTQHWVDFRATDAGAKLTQIGQPGMVSFTASCCDLQGAQEGQMTGVPSLSVETVLFSSSKAPGKVLSFDSNDPGLDRFRAVFNGVQLGDYVYLSMRGVNGLIIAKLVPNS